MTPAADQLNVGHKVAGGKPFRLPADIVTRTIAILGIRGSGKTNTLGCIDYLADGMVVATELLFPKGLR